MTGTAIRFRCPRCTARIKAPVALIGRTRECPGCGRSFTVPQFRPADAEPVLVLIEGEESCSLGVAYRRGA